MQTPALHVEYKFPTVNHSASGSQCWGCSQVVTSVPCVIRYRIWEMWSFTFGWCKATKSNFMRTRHTGQNFRPWYVRTFYIQHSWSCEFFRDEKWGEICNGLARLQSSYISYGRPISLESSWSQYVWVSKKFNTDICNSKFCS